jgi:hypothetical protein
VLILGLALTVRLVLGLWLLQGGDAAYVLASDDGDAYVAAARHAAFGEPIVLTDRMAAKWQLAADQDPGRRWPPAYWLFLAAQYRLLGCQHLSAIVLQAALGAIAAWATYRLALRLLPSTWAVTAGALAAISSTLAYLSAALYAEALYIPLLLLASELCLQRNVRAAHIAGIAIGLAETTRPLALALLPILAWGAGKRQLPHMTLGFAIAMAPFLARDLLILGFPATLTAGGREALTDAVAGAMSPMERVSLLFLSGGWMPLGEPLLSASPQLALIMRPAFWLVSAIGAIALLRRRRQLSTLLILLALAIVLPPLLVGLPLVRYRAPADALFVVWFVAGAYTCVRIRRPRVDVGGGSAWRRAAYAVLHDRLDGGSWGRLPRLSSWPRARSAASQRR